MRAQVDARLRLLGERHRFPHEGLGPLKLVRLLVGLREVARDLAEAIPHFGISGVGLLETSRNRQRFFKPGNRLSGSARGQMEEPHVIQQSSQQELIPAFTAVRSDEPTRKRSRFVPSVASVIERPCAQVVESLCQVGLIVGHIRVSGDELPLDVDCSVEGTWRIGRSGWRGCGADPPAGGTEPAPACTWVPPENLRTTD